MSTTHRQATSNSLASFMSHNPTVEMSHNAWRAAFDEGANFGTTTERARCRGRCGGTKRVETNGSGWVRCPGCIELTHLSFAHTPGAGPKQSRCDVLAPRVRTERLDEVTCACCLQGAIQDLHKKANDES